MDELEFRRRVYANPFTTDTEVVEAAKNDISKEAFWNELKKLNAQLHQVADVPVPDDFAYKLIWQQTTRDFARHKQRSRWYIALAASVAFSVGIGFTFWYQQQPLDIGSQALAHMRYAELEAPHSALPVSKGQINAKLAGFGAHLVADIGDVEVANYCHLNQVQALHLIVSTTQGKMSVFVVPQHKNMDLPSQFSDNKYQGSGFEYQNTNILVVGNKNADLEPLKSKVKKSLQFST
ncbi:DUF3379 domain-containing protein [Alteromonas pelagimontana]|uniref:DUF3379 domain-containing protein n=1 Tax=Alteromonas pelagimontana TaxID=1858656 RepID=A0A6M4M9P9_9ALTE|nr:DUF3379 family protein [Alteromonas pelagimontana]QJR79874.1 DUF3379 domain-containing protein [Alteromonas pelagimontana]